MVVNHVHTVTVYNIMWVAVNCLGNLTKWLTSDEDGEP